MKDGLTRLTVFFLVFALSIMLSLATVDLITLTGDALLFPTISNPQPFP